MDETAAVEESNQAWIEIMIISDSPILNFGKHAGASCIEVLADEPTYLLWLCGRVWVLHNHPELWEWLSQNGDLIISEAVALIEWRGERAA